MSASGKKKLRKEQSASKLTERQRQEMVEAKKLRNNTIIFVTAMVLVVAIALSTLGIRAIDRSGVLQKNTLALTLNDYQLNSVTLSYFYNDAIRNQYNQWYSSYQTNTDTYVKMMYGLDTTARLDKQIADKETGETWADKFVKQAIEDAKDCYAMYDMAINDKDFSLTDEQKEQIASALETTEQTATLYGFESLEQYLEMQYGFGADVDSYKDYLEKTMYSYAYSTNYRDALNYTPEELANRLKSNPHNFSHFSFASYSLSFTNFLEGGTKGADGTTTYSDAEKDAARQKMKDVAESLAKATSVEELDKLIAALEINKDNQNAKSSQSKRVTYSQMSEVIAKWATEEGRKAGDIAAIPNPTVTKNDDGTETSVLDNYFVVLLQERDDNGTYMANVRHLLVQFEGGKQNSSGGMDYTDAEKAKAKQEAEDLLNGWKNNNPTQESFIALVKEKSDDSSKETGGLFEDIHIDSQYVENFKNWCIDPKRQKDDVEIIETEYGYHIMYFVDYDEMTYQDYLITEDLKNADYEEWFTAIVNAMDVVNGDFSRLDLDKIISSNY